MDDALPEDLRDAHRFAFGDSPALADELLALVLSGAKTATGTAVRPFVLRSAAPAVRAGRTNRRRC
jgi:Uncharacterized protein conserved in bacteria